MIVGNVETPNLTLVVTLHISSILLSFHVGLDDRAGEKANNHKVILDIDGSDQVAVHEGLGAFHRTGIVDVDSTISTARVQLAANPNDGSDHTAAGIMVLEGLLASVSSPNINLAVGTTGESIALIVGSNTSETGSLVISKETLLAFASG